MNTYEPPFNITNKLLDLVSKIMEKIGKLNDFNNLEKMTTLRKNNRINSIHSSLAIEANSLSLDQVRDVINGKLVLGPQKEIQEVKNAYQAYEMIDKVNPYSSDDLKKVHGIMTNIIVKDAGYYRKCAEGVFENGKCIFMAPSHDMVPSLMYNLFEWMNNSKNDINPLILSSIFHYEFVFIHPFSDGNGRMARLWQNVILSIWREIFKYLPIESAIKDYQQEYYDSISNCNKNGNSNEFIEFMLKMIDEILSRTLNGTQNILTETEVNISQLLSVMEYNIPMNSNEIMEKLEIKSKETLRSKYLDPAIAKGLIKLTVPDKPTSKNQKYYKA